MPAALETGAMAGGERGRLIEKEEFGVASAPHLAPPAFERANTDDPALRGPTPSRQESDRRDAAARRDCPSWAPRSETAWNSPNGSTRSCSRAGNFGGRWESWVELRSAIIWLKAHGHRLCAAKGPPGWRSNSRPNCEYCDKHLSGRRDGCADMLLRMHLLRGLRRRGPQQCLSQLRRRICAAPDPSGARMEAGALARRAARIDEARPASPIRRGDPGLRSRTRVRSPPHQR